MKNESLSALIKSLNVDNSNQKYTKLFSMIGQKLQEHDNILHSDVTKQAFDALHRATVELDAMRSLFASNGYVTKKEVAELGYVNKKEVAELGVEFSLRDRVEMFAIGLLGGIIGGLAVYYG